MLKIAFLHHKVIHFTSNFLSFLLLRPHKSNQYKLPRHVFLADYVTYETFRDYLSSQHHAIALRALLLKSLLCSQVYDEKRKPVVGVWP